MDNKNPEGLHDVGKGTAKQTGNAFVNPDPKNPLVNEQDTTKPELPKGTSQLRSYLNNGKDNNGDGSKA